MTIRGIHVPSERPARRTSRTCVSGFLTGGRLMVAKPASQGEHVSLVWSSLWIRSGQRPVPGPALRPPRLAADHDDLHPPLGPGAGGKATWSGLLAGRIGCRPRARTLAQLARPGSIARLTVDLALQPENSRRNPLAGSLALGAASASSTKRAGHCLHVPGADRGAHHFKDDCWARSRQIARCLSAVTWSSVALSDASEPVHDLGLWASDKRDV